jgi:protein ImuB
MLFACVFIPAFELQAILRAELPATGRKQRNIPIVLLDRAKANVESEAKVFAVNDAARMRSIEVGMTKMQAEQAGAIVKVRSVAEEGTAQAALLDCVSQFSPRIEVAAAGAILLDVEGMERLFGQPPELATALAKAIKKLRFRANVAIASNPDVALIAARGVAGITVISSGKEEASLSRLSIDVLSPASKQKEILDHWGIRTCGELAKNRPVALRERLGEEGLALWKLARGESARLFVPSAATPKFEENIELEDSVDLLEPLLFMINRLLEQIIRKLLARSFSLEALYVRLGLEIHADRNANDCPYKNTLDAFELALKLPVPMHDAKTLLKLLQLELESHPPKGPVKTVALTAEPAKPRSSQGNLFVRAAPEPEKAEVLQAKLRSLTGQVDGSSRSTVGVPGIVDSTQPDNFTVLPFVSAATKKKKVLPPQIEDDLLRLYRPPKRARVRIVDGQPAHISFGSVSAAVKQCSGPWKLSGNWWTEYWAREIWDIELRVASGVACYRAFQDLVSNRWYVAGKFD